MMKIAIVCSLVRPEEKLLIEAFGQTQRRRSRSSTTAACASTCMRWKHGANMTS